MKTSQKLVKTLSLTSLFLISPLIMAQTVPQLPSSATMQAPTYSNNTANNSSTTTPNVISVPSFVPPAITQTPTTTAPEQSTQGTKKDMPSPTQGDRNAVANDLNKKSTTPTAAEQGLVNPHDQELANWKLRQTLNNESARQRGQVIPFPAPYAPVARNPMYQGWLANWEKALTDTGVGLDKIRFEEGRLTQEDFSRWASNQLRYQPNSISIESDSAQP